MIHIIREWVEKNRGENMDVFGSANGRTDVDGRGRTGRAWSGVDGRDRRLLVIDDYDKRALYDTYHNVSFCVNSGGRIFA